MSKASNVSAIERATGLQWDVWVQYLESCDAANQPHRVIAQLAEKKLDSSVPNPGWWAQAVAVAYEQHIGRRLPGQAADGSFQFSLSRTFDADLDTTLERWTQTVGSMPNFHGKAATGQPHISSSEKWRYWRVALQDGTMISVDIGRKGEKTSLVINHRKHPDPDQIPSWRDFWRSLLDSMSQ